MLRHQNRYSAGLQKTPSITSISLVQVCFFNITSDYASFLIQIITRVLIDDKDLKGISGGDGYKNYGIDKTGAIAIVRPDGYVGMVSPLDKIDDIDLYFGSFAMRSRNLQIMK